MKVSALVALTVLLGACGLPEAQSVKTPLSPAQALDTAANDATCSHGAIDGDRSFVLCENGALRRTGVETALATPVDEDLDIETVAKRYNRAAQDFIGIEVATYGSLLSQDRKPVSSSPRAETPKTAETVTIDGKLFDVYHLDGDEKSGVIFIERRASR